MNVKIDTKEKFTVITPIEGNLTANMTGELVDLLHKYLERPIPHVILNMQHVLTIENDGGERIAALQQQFYKKNSSFVICELGNNIQQQLERTELLDEMNTTPTESEAWDILQMEEVERELLRDFDNTENE